MKELIENLIYKEPKFIVGIGASAGGLHALQQLLTKLPTNIGASYIILQHLSPDFKSYMDELLKTYSQMKITMAQDCQVIEADSIYLLPERKNLIVADGKILLSDIPNNFGHRPIDYFFKSLAEEYQNSAIGVVLSGTGNDGSQGIIELHQVGAMTIVQDPETAEFTGMPDNAILTEEIDHVLAPEKIGPIIEQYAKNYNSQAKHIEDSQDDVFLRQCEYIFNLIDSDSQVDFRDYKSSTVKRRIINRMGILDINNLSDYIDYLEREDTEKKALFNDLLIGVTQFFRDPSIWDTISEKVIKKILIEKPEDEDIRVWVAGCSTGEEAYTLSILFEEAMRKINVWRRVRIFASDIDKEALQEASFGKYSSSLKNDLSEDILSNYFSTTKEGYVISDAIRSRVIFAAHNILRDPPFSKMDFISCRNLLIYFQSTAQRKILSYFHFSLINNGFLLLGTAETCSLMSDYFKPIDPVIKLFRKSSSRRISLSDAGFQSNLDNTKPLYRRAKSMSFESNIDIYQISQIKERLSRRFLPPTIILDESFNLIYSLNDTEKFTRKIKPGIHNLHYTNTLIEPLNPVISSLVKRLKTKKSKIIVPNIRLADNPDAFVIEGNYIEIQHPKHSIFYAISFITLTADKSKDARDKSTVASKMQLRISELDEALSDARVVLDERQHDVEAMTEELQSANEELMAANEELQSTNEELQSVNEELFTVNTEYQDKIKELELVNNDLNNILKFTDAGVVYLDTELLIRRFTPKSSDFIKILPLDINRSIMDLKLTFECSELSEWIEFCRINQIKTVNIVNTQDTQIEVTINPCFDTLERLDGFILLFKELTTKS